MSTPVGPLGETPSLSWDHLKQNQTEASLAALDEETAGLITQITVAFQGVRRGNGISLHETKVLDDYGDDSARQEAREQDTDTQWWEIPDEVMHHHHFYLTYLDAEGLRYYLPAWMIHALKHFHDPPDGRTTTLGDTLAVLTHSDRPDLAEWQKKKWTLLMTEQAQVICLYLRYVANHHRDKFMVRDAVKGLDQHWGQFCGSA